MIMRQEAANSQQRYKHSSQNSIQRLHTDRSRTQNIPILPQTSQNLFTGVTQLSTKVGSGGTLQSCNGAMTRQSNSIGQTYNDLAQLMHANVMGIKKQQLMKQGIKSSPQLIFQVNQNLNGQNDKNQGAGKSRGVPLRSSYNSKRGSEGDQNDPKRYSITKFNYSAKTLQMKRVPSNKMSVFKNPLKAKNYKAQNKMVSNVPKPIQIRVMPSKSEFKKTKFKQKIRESEGSEQKQEMVSILSNLNANACEEQLKSSPSPFKLVSQSSFQNKITANYQESSIKRINSQHKRKQRGLWNYGIQSCSTPERFFKKSLATQRPLSFGSQNMSYIKKIISKQPNQNLSPQQEPNNSSQRASTQHFINTDFQAQLAKQRNKLIHKQVIQKAFKKNHSKKFRLHNFDDHQHAINKAQRLIELCQITDQAKNRTRSSMQESNYYSSNDLIKLTQRRYQNDEAAPTYLQSTQSIQHKKRDKYILVQKKTKQRKLKEQKEFRESQNKWLKREPSLCSQDFNDAINARHQRNQVLAQGLMANFDPDLAKLMVTTKTNEANAGAKRNILTHIGVTSNFQ